MGGRVDQSNFDPFENPSGEMRLPVNVVNHVDERLRILRANLRKYYHIPDVQCSRIEKEKENLVDPSCDNASKLALSQKYLTT